MKEISIAEIKGLKVGQAQDLPGGTGCTVILYEEGAVCGVDVRGGGPATRETDLLNPVNMVEQIHAVVLSGGSAFGLDAASGVMRYLEERGKGFDVGVGTVPIVCGASLFDLAVGDPAVRPDGEMGYTACENASCDPPEEGNAGAGTGATVGKFLGPARAMKSGLGVFGLQSGRLKAVAIVAVNALGDVLNVDTGERIAGLLSEDGACLDNTEKVMFEQCGENRSLFSGNTTIACVITNARLTKAQASKMASVAHNGLARTIRPVHTMADGDTVFFMATGEEVVLPDAAGALGAEALARAVNRAVREAKPAYGLKAYRDLQDLKNK